MKVQIVPQEELMRIYNPQYLLDIASKIIIKEHEVILRGGIKSSYYIDIKETFTKNPKVLSVHIGIIVKELITGRCGDEKVFVAGQGLSGIMLATVLATAWPNIKPIFVRETVKSHGIVQKVIGDLKEAQAHKVVLVDDVVTTGETLRRLKAALEDVGIKPKQIVVLVTRNEEIKHIDGIPLTSLFKVVEK